MSTASVPTLRSWMITGLMAAATFVAASPVSAQSAGLAVTADMIAPRPVAEPVMVATPPGHGPGASAARMIRAPVPPTAGATMSAPRPRPHVTVVAPPPATPHIRILATLGRVEGTLARAMAQAAMPGIEIVAGQCFTSALAVNPSVQGLMVLRLTVDPTGAVADVEEAANYVRDANLSACLSTSVRAARFPGFAGTAPSTASIQLRFLQR